MSKKIYKNKGCSSSMDQTLLNIIKSMEYYFSPKNIIKGCKTSENQLNSPLVLQQHEQNISIDFLELNEYDHDHDHDYDDGEEEEEEGNKLNLSREVLQQHEQISIDFSELNEYDHDHDYDYGEEEEEEEEEEEGNKLNLSREVLQQHEQISIDFSELNDQYDHDHDYDYDYDYDYDDGEEEEEEEEEEDNKLNLGREVVINERWKNHYSNCHKILLVGEGDFSFSNSLAMAFGSATNMIATSLDSQGFLASNYGNAMSNIQNLHNRGCMVLHGVDATQMANYFWEMGLTFDRVVFNFPHAGFQNESRSSELSRHRTLIRMFLKNAKKMIMDGGEIHITHKSNRYFREWDLEFLASGVGLQLIEEEPFNFREYLGYRTKYGFGGDKNFNCNPSKTYKFGFGFAFGIPKYHMIPCGWDPYSADTKVEG